MSPESADPGRRPPASSVRAHECRGRVLVVDDAAETRELYVECLGFHGFRAEAAEDGPSGLAMAATSSPDVIVLDFSMPRMDGGEVLKRLRADERTRDIPVVMLTAVLELVGEDVRGACEAYLEKPCDPDHLVSTLGRVCASRAARRTA